MRDMGHEDTVVLHSAYFPSVGWYRTSLSAPELVLDEEEFFVRKSSRNRFLVCGPNGTVKLTVPLEGGRNQHSRMKDLKIAQGGRWPVIHWRTLEACYGRAPFFLHYAPALEPLLVHPPRFLMDAQLQALDCIDRSFRVDRTVIRGGREGKVEADPQAGVAGLHYLQPFAERHGFVNGLSVLDLLLCCGPAGIGLLPPYCS